MADDHLYLKDLSPRRGSPLRTHVLDHPVQSSPASTSRALGYDIVANFGDQLSDLTGGFADKTFKLPNPMYFLP